MFFFCLALFLLCGWLLPWWGLALIAFFLGIAFNGKARHVALAAAAAWTALAYIHDGQSHGIIARRMAGLFGLPSPYLIFLLMAILGALTALFFFQAGAVIRGAVKSSGGA
jgi:hypothetical protein